MKKLINLIKTRKINNNKYFRIVWKYTDEDIVHTDYAHKNGNKYSLWQVNHDEVEVIEISVVRLKEV